MFFSLWRRLRNRNPVLARGKSPRGVRCLSYQPGLEPLEDRALPTLGAGGLFTFVAVPSAVSGPPQTPIRPIGAPAQTVILVAQNSPETVINLGAVFGAMPALRPGDGLKLSVLGNTNSGLVQTDLSGAALTLTYARGQSGTAVISVGATDADGVSARQTLVVTVQPPMPAGMVGAALAPLGSPAPPSSPAPLGPPAQVPPGAPPQEPVDTPIALPGHLLPVDLPDPVAHNTGR